MHRSGGFSIVETMIAASILAVGLLGMMTTFGSSAHLREVARENDAVIREVSTRLEKLRGLAKSSVDATKVDATAVLAAVDAQATFTIAGLSSAANATGTMEVLGESDAKAELGWTSSAIALDLDGDGSAPGLEETAPNSQLGSYTYLIPVRVKVTWRSITGQTRRFHVTTALYPRK